MDDKKVSFLAEFNQRIYSIMEELGEKYEINLEEQLFYAYYIGLGDGVEQDHFTADAMCSGIGEMNLMIEKIREEYEDASLDGLLGDIYLN